MSHQMIFRSSLLILFATLFLVGCSNNLTETVNKDIKLISSALITYFTLNGSYPTSDQGLHALLEMPSKPPIPIRWQMIIQKLPKDPWGRDYQYTSDCNSFTLKSHGEHLDQSRDDISFTHKNPQFFAPPKVDSRDLINTDKERKPRIRKLNV